MSDSVIPQSTVYMPPSSGEEANVESLSDIATNSNYAKLKTHLRMVTHERDVLKRDVKRLSMERKGSIPPSTVSSAYNVRHSSVSLPVSTCVPEIRTAAFHMRTVSDVVPSTLSNFPASVTSLSGSHSIPDEPEPSSDELQYQLHIMQKRHSDEQKRYEQAVSNAKYYHDESHALKKSFSQILEEKQELEQELLSLRTFVSKLGQDMRIDLQDARLSGELSGGVTGDPSSNVRLGNFLRNLETSKAEYSHMRKQYDDIAKSHSAVLSKFEIVQDENVRFKKLYQETITERNQFKQQCTQAIRQWDQALRERNEYKEALAKVQRQHDEVVKEVNHAMSVRIKASKDIKRITEERNAAMQEYSLVMSERSTVHKELEKLQEELLQTKLRMSRHDMKSKSLEEERKMSDCQLEILKRELEQALSERDRALREAQQLREGISQKSEANTLIDSFPDAKLKSVHTSVNNSSSSLDVVSSLRPSRTAPQTSTPINTERLLSGSFQVDSKLQNIDTLDKALDEIERISNSKDKMNQELKSVVHEIEIAIGRRDWAYAERDKVVMERESIRTLCDKLRRERDRAVSELAEALRDSDEIKKLKQSIVIENKGLKQRMEAYEEEARLNALTQNIGSSHDSAIDTDLQEWETEIIDLQLSMDKLSHGRHHSFDLGLSLSGGLELHLSGRKISNFVSNPPYICVTSIKKGSPFDKKLRINDCIISINNVDSRGMEKMRVLDILRNTGKPGTAAANLIIRRRRMGSQVYHAVLPLNENEYHGLSLSLGVYVQGIKPGSVAAKEGSLSIGDRVIQIDDSPLNDIIGINEVNKLFDRESDSISLTFIKSVSAHAMKFSSENQLMGNGKRGNLASSSSSSSCGQNIINKCDDVEESINCQKSFSPVKVYTVNEGPSTYLKNKDLLSSEYAQNPNCSSTAISNVRPSPFDLVQSVRNKLARRRKQTKDVNYTIRSNDTVSSTSVARTAERNLHIERDFHLDEEDLDEYKAIVQLDSVLVNHSKGDNIVGKKKISESKNGGTWPRARTGGSINGGLSSGTYIHPLKIKRKERMPLSELLRSNPKYQVNTLIETESTRKDIESTSSNPKKSNHNENIVERNFPLDSYSLTSAQPDNYRSSECRNVSAHSGVGFIDNSVKSGHTKDMALQMYLKKSSTDRSTFATPGHAHQSTPNTTNNLIVSSLNNSMSTSAELGSPIPDYRTQYPVKQNVKSLWKVGSYPPSTADWSFSCKQQPANAVPSAASQFQSVTAAMTDDYTARIQAQTVTNSYANTFRRPFEEIPPLSNYAMSSGAFEPGLAAGASKTTIRRGSRDILGINLPTSQQNPVRIRFPSTSSTSSSFGSSSKFLSCNSHSSSIDRSLEKPILSVQYINSQDNAVQTDENNIRMPLSGDIRQIYIEKSSEPLGIKIEEGAHGGQGVFVSSVTQNSIAYQVGMQVGDQLLEVCGINLRTCGKQQAAMVLHQVGNSITMKVQYNPNDFQAFVIEDECHNSRITDDEESQTVFPVDIKSKSETPSNSPLEAKNVLNDNCGEDSSTSSTLRGPISTHSTLTRHQISRVASSLAAVSSPRDSFISRELNEEGNATFQPRVVYPVMKKSGDLGVRLVGGNAVGIYVHSVELHSPAYQVGLSSGDQILEYNGFDLRHATAQEAAFQLAKPSDKVSILVQYCPEKYETFKDVPGDSFYVQAMFDNNCFAQSDSFSYLNFAKNDILLVDSTMYNSAPSLWSAWLIDEISGQRKRWGIIPSQHKVEEDMLIGKRNYGQLDSEGVGERTRRSLLSSTRRSFFKRRKGSSSEGRSSFASITSSSSGYKELASFYDIGNETYGSQSLSAHNHPLGLEMPNSCEASNFLSYIKVERLDYQAIRPVLLIGPLSGVIIDKLASEYPHKFVRCEEEELIDCDQRALEKGVLDNIIVDFRRRAGSYFECTTFSSIKDVVERNVHCLLSVHLDCLHRLHTNGIFPIVLLIKFKSAKQIRDASMDPIRRSYLDEIISQKDAKNIYEHACKIEMEYKRCISDVIHASSNLMLTCTQIVGKVLHEQNKILWIPQ